MDLVFLTGLAFGTSTLLSANGERSRTIGFGFDCNSIIAEAAKWTPLDKGNSSLYKTYLTGWTEKGKSR